ncbi:MAG TPA: hypothetical protein PK079_09940 [Leptospiraceae bacterium]|nr:hypothetical protein [Leptospiraceae bacterium]HMX31737.1 hypothetical protein [Leptospiraceae bacterium]HMY30543.1 hypothetical protein [Leptospiraceae bacterium]HMZ64156.1 hypothetical protein [Leptospiraceae bacterium]HNB99808.1 hypothetical protein [Leptospiraceae bacterium]
MKRVIAILFLFAIFNCSIPKNHIQSFALENRKDRLETLQKYLIFKSEVLDAEYDIYDVNLNAEYTIPGATSRDYRIVLFLKKEDISKWLTDVTLTSFPESDLWREDLIQKSNRLKSLQLEKDYMTYKNSNKTIFYNQKHSILFIRINQN